MERSIRNAPVTAMACATFLLALAVPPLVAQKMTPADVAAKFTGTWTVNRDLSPGLSPAGGGRGARFEVSPLPSPAAFQRGGGRGGGGAIEISAEDRAGNAAIAALQGVAPQVEIVASVDSVTFKDPRGERTFPVTDKSVKVTISGAEITTKSKWDKSTLKQEFSFGESHLTQTWELNSAGDRLNMKMVVQNMNNPSALREIKAVYDKQK